MLLFRVSVTAFVGTCLLVCHALLYNAGNCKSFACPRFLLSFTQFTQFCALSAGANLFSVVLVVLRSFFVVAVVLGSFFSFLCIALVLCYWLVVAVLCRATCCSMLAELVLRVVFCSGPLR